MKKVVYTLIGLIFFASLNAQTIDDIVKRYTIANRLDRISSLKTIKLSGNMSMMGAQMPLTMWMKNPDKIKTVTSFYGQEMIQVFDGKKGYLVNPLAGSAVPREMTQEEIKQIIRNNIFQNYMATYLANGELSLVGVDEVNNKPAFKLKASLSGGTEIDFFIDKSSYLMVKISSIVSQSGTKVTLDAYPTDYTETNGLLIPMKTTTTAQGMQIELNLTKVETNIPMDDSIFNLN
jgi:outer membrane lipoprotein-sorting protein